MKEISQDILKNIYKERKLPVKKYDFGHLVVIGGSEFYSGSPAFSALAAFKSGVDMVKIIAPRRAADIIASFSPNLAAYPLEGNWLEQKHLATLLSIAESANAVSYGKAAVVIGGGAGRSEQTQNTIIEFLLQVQVPAVIDADAIHAVAKKPEILAGKPFLLTPHSYEFYALTKKEVYKLPEEEKIKVVQEEAARLQTTILLKGVVDIISDGKEVALCRGGSPYMTKGGMGDTLAGICGSLLARGCGVFEAACAASYINKKAGEIACAKLKESVMATDLIEAIPEAIRS